MTDLMHVEPWLTEAYAAVNRGDPAPLKALACDDIEIVGLLAEVTSAGPWSGHTGIDRLLDELRARWDAFELEPLDATQQGERIIVRVAVRARTPGGIGVAGEALHVLLMRDGRVARFEALRVED